MKTGGHTDQSTQTFLPKTPISRVDNHVSSRGPPPAVCPRPPVSTLSAPPPRMVSLSHLILNFSHVFTLNSPLQFTKPQTGTCSQASLPGETPPRTVEGRQENVSNQLL